MSVDPPGTGFTRRWGWSILQESRRQTEMTLEEAMTRIATDPSVCGGRPCIRGTRIEVSIVLDGLAEGLSEEQILDHFPSLEPADVRAAAAYASEMTRENIWKVGTA